MTSEDAVQALGAWARATIDELIANYDHVPASKPEGLPDVVVEAARTGIAGAEDTRFRYWAQLQQANVYFVESTLSFMVDNSDPASAAALLRSMENRLLMSVIRDATLGGRVPFASPLIEFDFTGPFVEYVDGTKGREMTMTIAVGDLRMAKVTYKGVTKGPRDSRAAITVAGVRLPLDEAVQVDDQKVLDALPEITGHKFDVSGKAAAKPKE
jgi:hypothetical protein